MSDQYSSDELNPPAWLNADFFKTALSKFLKEDSISIKNVEIRPGTKPGQHYASIMFRAEVTYDTKTSPNAVIKLILKTVPTEEGHKMEFMREATAFKTEMRMYEEVLPEIQKLLKGINDPLVIAPTLVYQSNDPAPVIVFIDETPNGFKPYEKNLSFEEAQIAIQTLAKFHACSLFVNKNVKDLTLFDDCPYIPAPGRTDFLQFFFMKGMIDSVKATREWEGEEALADKLEKNLEVFEQRVREVFNDYTKQSHQVLVHGDFQFRNMIFRNEGAKSEDFLLLDYQYCYWNTPAIDIFGLLYNVCNEDVRVHHRNDVLMKYHQVFKETLEKLNYNGPIPRLLDIQMELLRAGIFEYMMVLYFVPFQFIDLTKLDFEEVMEKKDFFSLTKEAFHSKEFKEVCIKRLKHFIEMGVLD
ncbi:uncharacterized protein LOC134838115 [Culicoides brevitarsis]|uniref:uncharacterized protein LOC134838115 n=1 Tax=Culicoides brevitarsis TaxID=469753 RepID=UPI00307CAFC5